MPLSNIGNDKQKKILFLGITDIMPKNKIFLFINYKFMRIDFNLRQKNKELDTSLNKIILTRKWFLRSEIDRLKIPWKWWGMIRKIIIWIDFEFQRLKNRLNRKRLNKKKIK